MCKTEPTTQGISEWCDFCPFVTDNEEEAALHQRDNPDHITHRVEFSYSINNKPETVPGPPQASKTIFICVTHEIILKSREEREKHALTPLCHVVALTASYDLGGAMKLSESERERLK